MKYYKVVFISFFTIFLANCSTSKNVYAQAAFEDSLYVNDAVLAKNVVERKPVNVVQSFTLDDEKAWCFARIYNQTGSIQTVAFEWYYEDDLYYEMDSKIGQSANWRTYSSVTLKQGTWRVEIKGPDGNLMKEIRFNVSG